MTAREKFLKVGLDQLEKPVLMGGTAPYVFDCSELVAWCLKGAGGKDFTKTHTAQRFHDDESRALVWEEPVLPGDLGFYGADAKHVVHVVIMLAGGHVLSADGATWKIRDLATAAAAGAKVRVHSTLDYRSDCPYVVVRRFTALDAVDLVTK